MIYMSVPHTGPRTGRDWNNANAMYASNIVMDIVILGIILFVA